MPRTAIATAVLPAATSAGLRVDNAYATADVDDGDVFDAPFVIVKNAHATDPKDVTFTATKAGELVTKTIELVAGETRVFRLDRDVWGDHGGADVGATYLDGESTDIKVFPFRG